MKKLKITNKIRRIAGIPFSLAAVLLPVALGLLIACSGRQGTGTSTDKGTGAGKNTGADMELEAVADTGTVAGTGAIPGKDLSAAHTYTCPMHPQIVKNEPGTCPICGMDLVPFDKNNKEEWLTLGSSQQALANITTTVIGKGNLSDFIRLNGILAVDPTQTAYISSRVAGRVETLFVKETGVPVKKGQPLYRIYSEQLSALQQEYLLTNAQALSFPGNEKFRQLEAAARQKLLLYGQSPARLQDLLATQKVSPLVTFYAPISGMVAELSIIEGGYVAEGETMMLLESYHTLWVEANIYAPEQHKVSVGQQVKVILPGYESQPGYMTIRFIAPSMENGKQVLQIRGTLSNPGLRWQPGLQAIVLLPASTGNAVLSLPANAVIRESSGAHVWIEDQPGRYEPRKVITGLETAGQVEITEGLEPGEKAVVSGAYLLYSEYLLKKGMHPVNRPLPSMASPGRAIVNNDLLNSVYQQYELLTNALIKGDPAGAKIAAGSIEAGARAMAGSGPVISAAVRIMEAKNIETQRAAYAVLSNALISRVKQTGVSRGKLYIDFCPMAFNDKGGSWLSATPEIRNPYFGDKMMQCGEVKDTIR